MRSARGTLRTRRRRRGATRRPLPSLAVALAVVALVAAASPAGAASPAAAPAPQASRTAVDARAALAVAPARETGDPAAGPYEPGFIDAPLPTNPISPSLDDVVAESRELDAVQGLLDGAERRRDEAIDHRDALRADLVDLDGQRIDAIEALAQRQDEERQRGVEREAAVADHLVKIEEAEAAARRLATAQEAVRELMVAAFVTQSQSTSDDVTLMTGEGDIDEALLRVGYGDGSSEARVADVRRRLAERDEADAARDRAAVARAQAEQAERDAIAAREAAEQHIVDVEDEIARTQQAEAAAVEALAAREADVLVAAAEIAPARLRADIVAAGVDFPLVALDAWVKAAASAPCRMEWWVLAGISKIEGRHGTHGGGRLGARGFPSTEIIGPQLNGAGFFAEIRDTDGGAWDHDTAFDRAVGPMQFIPSTWRMWGRDGDGDGDPNPHTVYDAAAGAAAYLCYGRSDLGDEGQLRAAYFSYNHSTFYVDVVLAAARGYQAALVVAPHVPTEPRPPS